MRNIELNDDIFMKDELHKSGLWARTQIVAGYGDFYTDDKGMSQVGEVVFEDENMVPLAGVQYAMEMIFGISGPLTLPNLNQADGIGAQNSTISPSGGNPYAYGQKVCLFGVGIGGAAENNITALDVNYWDTNVSTMVPFRYTNVPLGVVDQVKYYGKKLVSGVTAYYLKKFEDAAVIKHLYQDREDLDDGTELDNTYFTNPLDYPVQSFTEMRLTISKNDIKEWFNATGNIEETRVNSIGLFTAIYDTNLGDYAKIQLFSKLNIASEPLANNKDMNIVYRVYGT